MSKLSKLYTNKRPFYGPEPVTEAHAGGCAFAGNLNLFNGANEHRMQRTIAVQVMCCISISSCEVFVRRRLFGRS